MEEVSVEHVVAEDVVDEVVAVDELLVEDVLVLGTYLDLVSELQFKKQVKILAKSEDENVRKFLKQLVKVNEKIDAKFEQLKEEYEDYDRYPIY